MKERPGRKLIRPGRARLERGKNGMRRTVLCYGDSNTYGYDPRSFLGNRYPADKRWTGIINAAERWTVLNRGENGRAIPRRPRELYDAEALLGAHPEAAVVTVMLGSNDLLQYPSDTAERVAERMETLLLHLRGALAAAHSAAVLLLIAPPPMAAGAWVTEERLIAESARLGACYRALAAKLSVCFADAAAWDVALAFDGVHFSEEGHRAFAKGIEPVLSSLARGN